MRASEVIFAGGAIVTRILQVMSVVCIALLYGEYLGGLELFKKSEAYGRGIFDWHPLLMTIAYVLCMGEVLMGFRAAPYDRLSRTLRTRLHWIIGTLSLVLSIAGMAVISISGSVYRSQAAHHHHVESHSPEQGNSTMASAEAVAEASARGNTTTAPTHTQHKHVEREMSIHDAIGWLAILLTILQVVIGIVGYLTPAFGRRLRAGFMPYHRVYGRVTFGIGTLSCLLGLQEHATAMMSRGLAFPLSAQKMTLAGAFVMTFATVGVLMLSHSMTTPEPEVLPSDGLLQSKHYSSSSDEYPSVSLPVVRSRDVRLQQLGASDTFSSPLSHQENL